jgi:hypothetical protein
MEPEVELAESQLAPERVLSASLPPMHQRRRAVREWGWQRHARVVLWARLRVEWSREQRSVQAVQHVVAVRLALDGLCLFRAPEPSATQPEQLLLMVRRLPRGLLRVGPCLCLFQMAPLLVHPVKLSDFRQHLACAARPVEAVPVHRVCLCLFRLAQVNPPEKPQACRSDRVELAPVCPFVKVEWPGRL